MSMMYRVTAHNADLQVMYRDGKMVTIPHRLYDNRQILIHVKKIFDRPFVLTSMVADHVRKAHAGHDAPGSKFSSHLVDEAGGVVNLVYLLAEKSTPRARPNGDILAASTDFGLIMGGDSLLEIDRLEKKYGLCFEASMRSGLITEEAKDPYRSGCLLMEKQISDYLGLQTTTEAQIALEPVSAWRLQNSADYDPETVAIWRHVAEVLNLDIQDGFRIMSAYPGRVGPKVPGDPSLRRAPNQIVQESLKFWRSHIMLQTSILSF